jgi:superfamily I DNA and/or RNA helicase
VLAGGKSIGFLEDMARLNVGLTRAKLALILIGNLDTLAVSR